MVVCQYFARGRCYFGQNCKNEHIYNYTNGEKGTKNTGNNQANNVVWQISNAVLSAEKGGQWPLSSFAPIKDGPCLPGWTDVSPEEVRWTLYEAQKNGTVNQALIQIKELYKNAEKARNLLKQPSAEVINMLNDILKGKKIPNAQAQSSFGGFEQSGNAAKSTFRFDTAVNNIFGQSPSATASNSGSIFGGSSPFQNRSIFGNANALPSSNSNTSIFSQPQSSSVNIFSNSPNVSQNIFSNNSQIGSSPGIFGTPNTSSQNIFQTQTNASIFANNTPVSSTIFGGSATGSVSGNIFQNGNAHFPQPFGIAAPAPSNSNVFSNKVASIDSQVYSKLEDLNEKEITAFTSTTFTFGNIPLKPPARQYC